MLKIRKATVDDVFLIHTLAEQVFPVTFKDILSQQQIDYMMDWMYSLSSLRSQIMEKGHIYYIAYNGNDALGYVSIQPQGSDIYHLQKIYVLPTFQGNGYGKRLFFYAVNVVKSLHPNGLCRIELNVNRQNKALQFYQKMGMYKISQGDFDIGNGYYMNDYIMALDVNS
jgi:diamine N-acetyltransferase